MNSLLRAYNRTHDSMMLAREELSTDLSSSDEDVEKLKAAVDTYFLTDDLYKEDASDKTSVKEPKELPSLRNQNRETAAVNPFTIKVTPEFQKHVSKHLSKMLDELFDDTEPFLKSKKVKKKKTCSGVRLLRGSMNYVTEDSNLINNSLSRKFLRKNDMYNSKLEEKKAKEVAVTPEWVLSQEETKNWAPNTKGEVEVVQLDANTKIIEPQQHKRKKKRKSVGTNCLAPKNQTNFIFY